MYKIIINNKDSEDLNLLLHGIEFEKASFHIFDLNLIHNKIILNQILYDEKHFDLK